VAASWDAQVFERTC